LYIYNRDLHGFEFGFEKPDLSFFCGFGFGLGFEFFLLADLELD